MQRPASYLAIASMLLAHSGPAFAYQAHNWPGVVPGAVREQQYAPFTSPLRFEPTMQPSLSAPANAAATLGDERLKLLDGAMTLTRAQFTQMLIGSLYPASVYERCLGRIVYRDDPHYKLLFADMGISHPAAKEVCMAMRTGLVRGYEDGTFRPDQPINFAEASKLLSKVFAFTPFPTNDPKITWYRPYVDALALRNLIPQTVVSFSAQVTADDLREMLDRIRLGITWRPSLSTDELSKKSEMLWRARG
jgi:hypothetical protein